MDITLEAYQLPSEAPVPVQYQAFIKCPNTGQPVPTSYFLIADTFGPDEKPAGVFNCPLCKAAHFWSYQEAAIHLSAT